MLLLQVLYMALSLFQFPRDTGTPQVLPASSPPASQGMSGLEHHPGLEANKHLSAAALVSLSGLVPASAAGLLGVSS